MHPFLNDFSQAYVSKLGKRYSTFYRAFEYLLSLEKPYYNIIETGTMRRAKAFEAEGLSTKLFDDFLNYQGIDGSLISIDISKENAAFSASQVSAKASVICADSVGKLYELSQADETGVDLLYLDSYDLDWNNPHPSSLHHLHEFLSAYRLLRKGTLIMIDDNARGIGKGGYVHAYMDAIQKPLFFNEYQIGWIW